LIVQTVSSSVIYSSGSNVFGNNITNTQTFTGSVLISGSSTALNVNSGSFFISSSGNIGINTTNPNDLLEVRGYVRLSAGTGSAPQFSIFSNNQTTGSVTLSQGFATAIDNIGYLFNRANADFVFGTNNTERFRISSTGVITFAGSGNGIPLIIQDISAAITGQTAGYIGMSTSAYSGNNGDLVLYPRTSATSKILLMGGNVGIGTTTPASQLHIATSGATNAELRIVGYGYGSNYNTTLRSTVGSIGVLQFGNNGDNYILAGNTAAGGYLIFRINCSAESITSGVEAMRIASSGAVYKYISAIDTNSEMHYNIVASGGNTTTTTTTNGATYKIHTFTSTGTFTVYGYGLVEILVVGGGGGGGFDVGGGGGAGGYVETSTFVNTGAYTITIGGGGSGNAGPGGGTANSGVQSTALGFVALGGGGGGNYSSGTGGNGANGGGGAGYVGGYIAGGTGTFRQGNDGGAGRSDLYGTGATGGGGGGAAASGSQSTNNVASYALGGAGVISFISGSSVTYCKGGAGGGDSWGGATDGAANTGNGGDGAGNPNTGKNGGSGVVIIRYKV